MPSRSDHVERLASVLHVLYLIFNEGYASTAGASLQRTDLSSEAIRLARMVHALAPDEPEVMGLLALMLLTDARRQARTGDLGELIPLDEQNRGLWDRELIVEGVSLVERALVRGRVGPFQLQAAIAALHDEAPHVNDTDWAQILVLYEHLEQRVDNPVITLNRVIAQAMVHGPREGLRQLAALDGDERIAGHYRIDAVRAHLLERAGERDAAKAMYVSAAERTPSIPERDYLLLKAARVH